VLSVIDHGGSVTVRYRARGAALFVAAQTFDDGWTARTGDEGTSDVADGSRSARGPRASGG
jgi:uncharacterized protein GlcG (DUF336 family)